MRDEGCPAEAELNQVHLKGRARRRGQESAYNRRQAKARLKSGVGENASPSV